MPRFSLISSALLALVSLTGCSSAMPDADTLELATIKHWKEVPKSHPTTFVKAFDRFCTNRPEGMAAMDTLLRQANYVPKPQVNPGGPTVYVVDDRRPAVVVNDTVCGVRATSRTGQTERVRRYISETYPNARPVSTEPFSSDVEQAWQIPGGMIATTRNDWVGNRSAYSVVLFRPDN